MNFQETMLAQLSFLERIINRWENLLAEMPTGTLSRKIARKKVYYYEIQGDDRISLLSMPERRSLHLKKRQIDSQLSVAKKDHMLLKELLTQYEPLTLNSSNWDQIECNGNHYKAEEKKHHYRNLYFRSKSEMTIAMFLTSYDLKFKYEAEVKVGAKTVFPDFAVQRRRDGKVFFWEHFGLTFDECYLEKTFHKLSDYHLAGIDLWDNLIVSFDQEDGGIDADTIDKIIQLYLL